MQSTSINLFINVSLIDGILVWVLDVVVFGKPIRKNLGSTLGINSAHAVAATNTVSASNSGHVVLIQLLAATFNKWCYYVVWVCAYVRVCMVQV